jgi:hypothetical protein
MLAYSLQIIKILVHVIKVRKKGKKIIAEELQKNADVIFG